MKHSFKKHYKEARLTVKQTLKNKKNYLIYYTNLFMNIFTILAFVFRPVYKLCNLRMLRNMKEDKQLCISKSLEAADKPKAYWTYLINFATKFCLFFGIIVMHAVAIVLLYIFGLIIYYILNDSNLSIVVFVFAIPAVVALVAFVLAGRYFICPTAYIVEANEDIKCSSALYLSLVANKNQGKLALFLNGLTYVLKYVFYILVVYLVTNFIAGANFTALAQVILTNLVILAGIVGFLLLLPKESLTYRLIKFNIYNDSITDSLSKNALATGIRFEEVKQSKNMTETLLSIFENTNAFNIKEKKAIKQMPKFSGESSNVEEEQQVSEVKVKEPEIKAEEATIAVEASKLAVNPQPLEQNVSDSVQVEIKEEKNEEPTPVALEEAPVVEETIQEEISESVEEQPSEAVEEVVESDTLDLAEAMSEATEEPQKEQEEREEE